MGQEACKTLIETNRVQTSFGWIEYIPSKYLQFRFGNRFVRVFDVAQYFEGSLDYNGKVYLGISKKPMGSKEFRASDYGRLDILRYCFGDAEITQGLGEYVVTAFARLGVSVQSLASPAGILESYLMDQLGVRNNVNYIPREVLEFSMHSFNGAWFENFKAGTFPKTYRYDIVSAYPSVIRNLLDLSLGDWVQQKERPVDGMYGHAYATVTVPRGHISPVIFNTASGDCLRGYGTWTRHFNMQVIDWLRKHGGKAKIHDAYWFVPGAKVYRYRTTVDKFFAVKKSAKADSMEHWSSKTGLAGIYGKFLQHRGGRGGRLYNPVYADEITCSVYLRMADQALKQPDDIIAIMSDCVVSCAPLKLSDSTNIGGWKVKGPSSSLWLGPVQYEADGQTGSFRHIKWKSLLSSDPSSVDYTVRRNAPLTLVQGILQNRFDDVGVFGERTATFNIRKLNWKRFWPERPSCGKDLLTRQFESRQLCISSRFKDGDMKLWSM